jgi:hypothetical protein
VVSDEKTFQKVNRRTDDGRQVLPKFHMSNDRETKISNVKDANKGSIVKEHFPLRI